MSTERTVEDEIAEIEERLDELKEQVGEDEGDGEPDFPWDEDFLFSIDEKTWCGEANNPYWKIRTSAGVFNHSEVCAVRENLRLIERGDAVGEIIIHVNHPDGDEE